MFTTHTTIISIFTIFAIFAIFAIVRFPGLVEPEGEPEAEAEQPLAVTSETREEKVSIFLI